MLQSFRLYLLVVVFSHIGNYYKQTLKQKCPKNMQTPKHSTKTVNSPYCQINCNQMINRNVCFRGFLALRMYKATVC